MQISTVAPHSLDAERSVLGGLLLNNEAWELIEDKISDMDFYIHNHRIIFREISVLLNAGKPADVVTVSDCLERKSLLDKVGGAIYILELQKNTPSTANIAAYAGLVHESAIQREIIAAGNAIMELGYDRAGKDSKEILELAEAHLFKITSNRMNAAAEVKSAQDVVQATLDYIDEAAKNGAANNGVTGASTGYFYLDKLTSGFQPGDLIIVAARPSMGKTALSTNIMQNIALDSRTQAPALMFSLEMPSEQIMMRILSSLSNVELSKIRSGIMNDNEFSQVAEATRLVHEDAKLFIDDSSGLTPSELRAKARRLHREYGGLSVVVVDYLQLMRSPAYSDNRTLEIADISRSLKALAKELRVPVIALSQLNRSLESRANKRPINSDLRESGSLEQDADLILFIYRDEVYNENSTDAGLAEIIIGKQRNGPLGTAKLLFKGQYSRFDNYTCVDTDDY